MADDKRTQPRRRRPRDESADDSYPPNYTTLPVDERRDPNQVLTDMLTRLSCLDLSGRVTKIGTHAKSGGSYSDIFHGRLLSNGKLVAIRELRAHIFPEAELKKSIALELRIWSDLEHPNVLPLLGFTLDFGPHPVFVTEWMSNGTVLDYVKANPAASVLQLSIGIAAGLRYLHKREIVHADVKSSNVLVSPTGVPSLIDFGLSRLLVISQVIMSTREAGGTFRWMAHELCGGRTPEHWRESLRTVATKESDVWAYGMTVLELLTKSYPYSHLKTDFQVFSAIGKGSLPPKPSNLMGPEEIALWQDICSPCWSSTASHRPTMSELLKDLHDLEHSLKYSPRLASRENTNNRIRPQFESLKENPIEPNWQGWRHAIIQPLPLTPHSPLRVEQLRAKFAGRKKGKRWTGIMAVGGLKGMERRVAAVPATEIDTSVADLPRRPSHPHTSPPNAQKSATGTWKSKLQVQLPEPKRQWTLLGISVGSMASKPTVGAPGKTKRAASGDGTGDTLSPQMGADEKAVRQSPSASFVKSSASPSSGRCVVVKRSGTTDLHDQTVADVQERGAGSVNPASGSNLQMFGVLSAQEEKGAAAVTSKISDGELTIKWSSQKMLNKTIAQSKLPSISNTAAMQNQHPQVSAATSPLQTPLKEN